MTHTRRKDTRKDTHAVKTHVKTHVKHTQDRREVVGTAFMTPARLSQRTACDSPLYYPGVPSVPVPPGVV